MVRDMKILESVINRTENYYLYNDYVYDSYHETPGEVYRDSLKEYGRCTGKVYVDTDDGPIHVGWCFLKRDKYEDSRETFLRETWVTLLDKDELIRDRVYHCISKGR